MFFHEFPFLNTQDINLDWLLANMKSVLEQWAAYQTEMNGKFADLNDAFNLLHDFVEEYFDNLDVQEEIDNKINDLVSSGEFYEIILPFIESAAPDIIQGWLDNHPEATTTVQDGAITAVKLHTGAVSDAAGRDNTYNRDVFNDIAFTIPIYHGYYAQGNGSYNADESYRCFKIKTSGYIPIIYGTEETPIRYIFRNSNTVVGAYTPNTLPPAESIADHDEVMVNFRTTSFDSGDIKIFSKEMFQNAFLYQPTVDSAYITAQSWNSINDMPVNYIYQMGADISDSFGLFDNTAASTLIIIQATTRENTSSWRKIFFQVMNNKVYFKQSGFSEWIDLTNNTIPEINNKLSKLYSTYMPVSNKPTIFHGYYTQNGSTSANENYRAFKVATTSFPIVQGTEDVPIRYLFMLNGAVVGNYTSELEDINDYPVHDEVRINYHFSTFDTGDISVYIPEYYTNAINAPARLTNAYITAQGYSKMGDLPVNLIYQAGNDLPDTFGLQNTTVNSTVIVIQPNLHDLSGSWRKLYFQIYSGHIYFRTSDTTVWQELTVETRINALESDMEQAQADILELQSIANVKSVNILFIGNSYTLDEVGYTPMYLKQAFPELHWKIGIAYEGGATLENQYTKITTDAAYDRFYSFDSSNDAWTNVTNKKISDILDIAHWDIVVLQQGSTNATDSTAYQPYLNNLITELSKMIDNEVYFTFLMSHAWGNNDSRMPAGSTSDTLFSQTAAIVEDLLETTVLTEIIPSGTAIQNARTTSLDTYGAAGDMCADTNSHLQNGAPKIAANYVVFITIAKWLLRNYAGPYGDRITPDSTWLVAHSIPRANGGTAEGTDSNVIETNRLASAACALFAIKNPFSITDCSDYD